ncbi:MAG: hypothetical protein EOS38_06575 [Mesorhizobium sp.]|nr:MAG: hypothetical protein EOS38_06575 [Mesorhizobium sp.]
MAGFAPGPILPGNWRWLQAPLAIPYADGYLLIMIAIGFARMAIQTSIVSVPFLLHPPRLMAGTPAFRGA